MKHNLEKAVKIVGGQAALAEGISELFGKKIRQGHVWRWLNLAKKGVPAEYCPLIEKLTDGAVRREDLRPDIWGRG